MRSIVQSFLARHPMITAVGVGFRWVMWLLAGHLFGITAFVLAMLSNVSVLYAVLVWISVEASLALWGLAGLTTGAHSLYLWAQLCRFRRRWPGQFARSYQAHRWPPVVVDNHYSVPGGTAANAGRTSTVADAPSVRLPDDRLAASASCRPRPGRNGRRRRSFGGVR